jgi:Uma2 family endonuclease
MANALPHDFVPFADYLRSERDLERRHEYVAGQVYAMAGASRTHNAIATSFAALIERQLREGCQVWQSDMKVILQNRGQSFGYYPDIMSACDLNEDDDYQCTKPALIVEVLSASTERVDLREKFDNYISIPTLLEHVVVSQDMPLLRLFRRRTSWQQEVYRADDVFGALPLESVELDVPVAQIYRRVRREVGLDAG